MPETFTPLTIPGFRQAGQEAARFKTLTPTTSPGSSASGGVPLSPARMHACATTPAIHLERDGDKITHIRLECPCGQVFELECTY